jgi:hypothetical protein
VQPGGGHIRRNRNRSLNSTQHRTRVRFPPPREDALCAAESAASNHSSATSLFVVRPRRTAGAPTSEPKNVPFPPCTRPRTQSRNSQSIAFRDSHVGNQMPGISSGRFGKVGFPVCRFQLFKRAAPSRSGNYLPWTSPAKPPGEASAPTRRSSDGSGRHQAVATDGRAASAISPTHRLQFSQSSRRSWLTRASETLERAVASLSMPDRRDLRLSLCRSRRQSIDGPFLLPCTC